MQVASGYEERRTALAPYLDRLGRPEKGPKPMHPAIDLKPWELSALEEALARDRIDGDPWPALLAESVAFQQKYLSENDEMEREEYTSPESLKKQAQRLTQNAAIGLALLEDLQRVIDATILKGKMGEAKRLTGFRNRLAQLVKGIKERLSAEDCKEAESMHREMLLPQEERGPARTGPSANLDIHPDEANQPPPSHAEEPEEGPPKPIKLNRYSRLPLARAVEEEADYSKRLLVLFGIALVAWVILALPHLLKKPLPTLALPDLPQSATIQQVDARPPSLYVVVSEEGWRAISAEQRLQLVEEIGKTASAAGYSGVNVRTDEGISVAQWLKQKGPRLIATSGTGS